MNLNAIVSPYTATVNPSLVGTVMASNGWIDEGDAAVTGSITTNQLTVSAVTSGALAVGSALAGDNTTPGTTVLAFGTGTGGIGTYTVSISQTALSAEIIATGDGTRVPQYITTAGVVMQVQALTGRELEHIDSLNIQGTMRGVYINGSVQGLNRAAMKGGDVLLIPTGLTGQTNDTWLVDQVLEGWDTGGWCKVAVRLQNPPPDQ